MLGWAMRILLLGFGLIGLYFPFGSPVADDLIDLVDEHHRRNPNTANDQHQFNNSGCVYSALDFHGRVALHAPVVVGGQQGEEHRKVDQPASIVLVHVRERQIHHHIQHEH